MKTLLLAFLSLCFAVGIVAVAQDAPNQAVQKYQAAGEPAHNHHGAQLGQTARY